MNKVFKMLLVFVLIFMSMTAMFADGMVVTDSNANLRSYPCDECGEAMLQSNKTMSIFVDDEQIPCGCNYGTPGWGSDFKIFYDVYNTYVCSGCGYTLPRDKIGEQIKYWCIEASRFYDPITGQSLDSPISINNEYDTLLEENHEHELDHDCIKDTGTDMQNDEFVILGVPCSCGYGSLMPSSDLILSDDYTIQSRTVECKETPLILTRRDEVWRYYFWNTYICNYCDSVFPREKTQYYEEWGFCAHGAGAYPLDVEYRMFL